MQRANRHRSLSPFASKFETELRIAQSIAGLITMCEFGRVMTDEDRTILLIGSGPIQIGQAAEFDYSGAQACRALAEEGARVVLVNSNPATIMTDPEMADKVYIEPITTEAISEIIDKECPDGVIAGLGGQTGLNVTAELAEEGVLEEYDVEIMGTPLDTIYATEDRDLFRRRMEDIGQPVPASTTITLDDGESVTDMDRESLRERVDAAVESVGGLPVISRTTYTLGGSGSGVVEEREDTWYEVAGKALFQNLMLIIIVVSSCCLLSCCQWMSFGAAQCCGRGAGALGRPVSGSRRRPA